MPPVEPRMPRMEGHRWLQFCQLADKGWHCLISLAHHGNFGWWRYSSFCHLLSHCLTSLLNKGIWPCVCVFELEHVRSHVLFVSDSMCERNSVRSLMHVCTWLLYTQDTVHNPAHFFTELTINTLLPFSAHTYSVLLTVCCNMLYCCVCCVCCKVEGLS